MGYLKNKQVNLLNFHGSLVRFASSVIGIFGIVYLLKQGIPIHIILFLWSLIFILRSAVRPLSLKLQKRIGLKKGVIIGTLFYAGVFPVLSQVDGIGIWLFLFIVYYSIADTLYWLPYHSYYAAMGEEEHRGKHIGVREALSTIFTSIAPLAGGLLIVNFGFTATYFAAAVIMFLASIPVFFTKDRSPGEEMTFKKAYKDLDRRGFWLLLGDSILYNSHGFLWPVVLFLIVGNFVVMGGLLTLEMILTASLFLLLGHFIDKGKGKKILNIASILFVIVVAGRSFYVYDIKTILVFEVLAAFMLCFYVSSLFTVFYNLSKKSHNTLWFHFFGEIGWDVGAFFALASASLWTFLGFELRYFLPLSFLGLFIVRRVINSYFKNNKNI